MHVGILNEKTYQPAARLGKFLFEKNFDYIIARYANEGKDQRYCAPRNINLRENVCGCVPGMQEALATYTHVYVCVYQLA